MLDIEIDGKPCKVAEGTTIIEAADAAGIYIPRFCYHAKLSIAANCRMCLVEVDKSRKPLPACATPTTDGMKVFTRSPVACDAQKAVMEFLLINHPLDCPICDQGGECELQDLSMEFGCADSEYNEAKRAVPSLDIGPLIETEMTRCIHCTRCVRFGEEIAGLREMGMTARGENSEIGTYIQAFLQSELSGNIIDLCPVGALTNKPARYAGRAWEYREHPTIAPHDAVGSHVFVHTRATGPLLQRVMRVVPRSCEKINEIWMSDRDRYSVHGLYDPSRVYQPRIKINGAWVEVTWQHALQTVADKTRALIAQEGNDAFAALTTAQSTIEECFLLQKIMRALGSNHIDYRQREHDFSDQDQMPGYPGLGMTLQAVERLEVIILVGCNVRLEQPLLAHRVNKAVSEGAIVIAINAVDYPFAFPVAQKAVVHPTEMAARLATLARDPLLRDKKRIAIFLGEQANHYFQAAAVRAAARYVRAATGAVLSYLTLGPNAAGAWIAGAVPHRGPGGVRIDCPGYDAKALLTGSTVKPVQGYFLLNTEPEWDSAYGSAAARTLEKAEWVVCMTPFVSEAMEHYADCILPIAAFTETAGTFVNMEGDWQTFDAVSLAAGDARPGWKVLRVVAHFLGLPGFDYKTEAAVRADMARTISGDTLGDTPGGISENILPALPHRDGLTRLAPCLMYRTDPLVRRSTPLQEAIAQAERCVRLSPATAAAHGFSDGDWITVMQNAVRVSLPLVIYPLLADDTVLLSAGLHETIGLGDSSAPISLERMI